MWVLIILLIIPDASLCKTSMKIKGYSISPSSLPEGMDVCWTYCLPFSSAFLAICLTIHCLFSSSDEPGLGIPIFFFLI